MLSGVHGGSHDLNLGRDEQLQVGQRQCPLDVVKLRLGGRPGQIP